MYFKLFLPDFVICIYWYLVNVTKYDKNILIFYPLLWAKIYKIAFPSNRSMNFNIFIDISLCKLTWIIFHRICVFYHQKKTSKYILSIDHSQNKCHIFKQLFGYIRKTLCNCMRLDFNVILPAIQIYHQCSFQIKIHQ